MSLFNKLGISWSSGTKSSKENPEKAKRIRREVEETTRTGSFSTKPAFYKRKPEVVEAFQLVYEWGSIENTKMNPEWPTWFKEAIWQDSTTHYAVFYHENGSFMLNTWEGLTEIRSGDFIIHYPNGTILVYPEEVFHKIYEIEETFHITQDMKESLRLYIRELALSLDEETRQKLVDASKAMMERKREDFREEMKK